MRADDTERLERLLAIRREEEEHARQREASVARRVEMLRGRVDDLREELRSCRACRAPGAGELIDAHRCAARLSEKLREATATLEGAREELERTRQELTEAGRRRLAVERIVNTRSLRVRERREATAQAQLDRTGRLRSLLGER